MDLQTDNKINYVQYDTVLELDNGPMQIEFSISEETNMTWLSVQGQEIDCPDQFGYHCFSKLDQAWLDSTYIIAQNVRLCEGMQVFVKMGSTVPRVHMWKHIRTGIITPAVLSKNCEVILPFTKTFKKRTCDSCIHDLK